VVRDSNPWKFIKKSSSSHKDNGETRSPKPIGGGNENTKSKKNNLVMPSLNSLVSGKLSDVTSQNNSRNADAVAVSLDSNDTSSKQQRGEQLGTMSMRPVSTPHNVPTNNSALKTILDDDPSRRRFRRYLQTLKMDENIRFWDSVTILRSEPNIDKRASGASAIIQTFVLDSAPLQVNLSSKVRDEIIKAYQKNDSAVMVRDEFFQPAMDELFSDLRQADAFRTFMENDTFSAQDLSRSDPTILMGMGNGVQ
jgi:hypothetical protein